MARTHLPHLSTSLVAESGLTVALAVVLNAVTIVQMPQGGSVSLVMLPLFVFALRRGLLPGLVAGAAYGIIDAILKPYVVHWAQFVLDYPLAFACVGLAGLFAGSFARQVTEGRFSRAVLAAVIPGIVVGALARYAVHVVSGVIYFGEYAPEGTPVLAYSLAYNSYVIVSAVICAVVAPLLLRGLAFIRPRADA